jgi:MFS transporter, DHA2 family, lincomycin resistance protein
VSVYSVRSEAMADSGAVGVEAVAGGVHAAFVVAACLSVAAIVGALFVRTPEPEGAAAVPAGH